MYSELFIVYTIWVKHSRVRRKNPYQTNHSLDPQGEPRSYQIKNRDFNWSCHVIIFAIFVFEIWAHWSESFSFRIFVDCNDVHMLHKYEKMYPLALIYLLNCKCMGVVKCLREFELIKEPLSWVRFIYVIKIQVKIPNLSLIHIWRCRRYAVCRSRWSPYH